jgi:hypothetical protein
MRWRRWFTPVRPRVSRRKPGNSRLLGKILDLKICDFACGSAAFLVATARYLSARLSGTASSSLKLLVKAFWRE